MHSSLAARRPLLGVAALTVCLGTGALNPASAATSRTVSRAQIHQIVKFTGYHRLAAHHFQVADEFNAGMARFKVVRMDRARLGVPLSQVRRNAGQAIALAARRDSFTTTIKVGPGPVQRITYTVSPISSAERSHLRYIIFTPHRVQLDNLTRPQRMPFVEAMTIISHSERLGVTLLHDNPRTATWGKTGLSSNKLCAMVESLNAVSNVNVTRSTLRRLARHHVDLSYLTDPNHPNPTRHRELMNLAGRGFEIWSNSMGFAALSARTGYSYHRYAHRVSRMAFDFYKQNQMHYMMVSAAQYQDFAQSG